MTQRRCCCGSGGQGCCFTFNVTATHMQSCTLLTTVTNCEKETEFCTIKSFSVTNAYTLQVGALQPQQFVVSTEPDPENPCDCYGQRCVYTWTPTGITFNRQVNFTLGCTGSIPQTPTGEIVVGRESAPLCPGLALPFCGCCGPPFVSLVTIAYSACIPAQTVSGACGDALYYNIQNFGDKFAWCTTFRAYYCWDSRTPCTLTLKAIEGSGGAAQPSTGPGIAGDDCDCNNGSGNMIISPPCPIPQLMFCAPFTAGNAALIYQLAGQPPMTITGSSCACP